MKKKTNNKGFTLVEIIVVVVILGILSAIMMPTFLAYIDDVKTQQDIINAKELMTKAQKLFDEIYYNEDERDSFWVDKDGNISVPSKRSDALRLNWDKNGYSKRFKEMAGLFLEDTGSPSQQGKEIKGRPGVTYPYFGEDCPYMVGLAVGNYFDYHDQSDPRMKRRAYTVYGIVYQRTPESNAILFDGNQWITEAKGIYPFDMVKGQKSNTISIGGRNISVTVYFINGFVPGADPNTACSNVSKNGRA